MVYLPLLEETGYMPSAKYVEGSEILAHAQRIAERYDLCDNALFSTEVSSIRWDEEVDQDHRDRPRRPRGGTVRGHGTPSTPGSCPGSPASRRSRGSTHTSR
ncbi:MAG: hypothetical protein R2716_04625 [Microthrixaceae bacterium]